MRRLITFALLACTLAACDAFLDRGPLDAVTPQTFFQNERELATYVNGLYAYLPGESIYNGDFTSDNVVQKTPNQIVSGQHTVPQTGGGWSWDYLREVNFFLANYDNGGVPEAEASPYVGIARFFRAWFYFDKVKRFGDVPWYSAPLAAGDSALYKGRDPRVLVMDSVLADLDYAVAHVPADGAYGTVDRPVALALKARVCLHEGTFRKYHGIEGSEAWLQEAREAARQIIDSDAFSLFSTGSPATDYQDLFRAEDAIRDEVILPQTYDRSLGKTHAANYTFLATTYGNPGLTKSVVDTYLNADGTPFTSRPGHDTLSFYSAMQERDPRLAQTIRTPGYHRVGNPETIPPNFDNSRSGYQNVKFVMGPAYDAHGSNINDLPVIRYAEVLLIYAEASAELGTLTQNDLDLSINRLRDRAGMPHLQLAGLTADPMLADRYPGVAGGQRAAVLEIRRERRVELAMEGFRYDDLMRWKAGPLLAEPFKGMYFAHTGEHDLDRDGDIDVALVDEMPAETQSGAQYLLLDQIVVLDAGDHGNIVPHPSLSKVFDQAKHYYYPIPTAQLTLNPALEQTPGW